MRASVKSDPELAPPTLCSALARPRLSIRRPRGTLPTWRARSLTHLRVSTTCPFGTSSPTSQSLWDRIVEREHEVPLPEAHRSELARRVAEHRADPDNLRAWTEVEADLRSELARRRER